MGAQYLYLRILTVAFLASATPTLGETIVVYNSPVSPPADTIRGFSITFPSGGLETTGPVLIEAYVEGLDRVEITLVGGLYEFDAIDDNVLTDEVITLSSPDRVNDFIRSSLGDFSYSGVLDPGTEESWLDWDVDLWVGDSLINLNTALAGAQVQATFSGGTVNATLPGSLSDGFTIVVVPEPRSDILAIQGVVLLLLAGILVSRRNRKHRVLALCPVEHRKER